MMSRETNGNENVSIDQFVNVKAGHLCSDPRINGHKRDQKDWKKTGDVTK